MERCIVGPYPLCEMRVVVNWAPSVGNPRGVTVE